ncbi:MAG: hypothetical protein Q7R95_08985 [bacterium]|nr:hypothetical protein [bacterium]
MGSITETENRELLENKPYFTKIELSVLLEKKGKNLDKKILQLTKNTNLISLKNGFYITKTYKTKAPTNYNEYLSNVLYYPSYLSLEYVLQKEGVLPESVMVYTSITNKTTKRFNNVLGSFNYRSIQKELFVGYQEVDFWQEYKIKIATKAKALFDFLYLKSFKNISFLETINDLRLNYEVILETDLDEFEKYTNLINSPKMKKILKILRSKTQ